MAAATAMAVATGEGDGSFQPDGDKERLRRDGDEAVDYSGCGAIKRPGSALQVELVWTR
jgi:hypothetical protein